MNVIIIEDEMLSAEDLARIISEMDENISVLAIVKSVKEAIDFLTGRTDVDLIFSDIQLGDGLSFEIFKAVDLNVPIIFCTAFNEYALEAFKINTIDYILKPYDSRAVSKAINKYYQVKRHFSPSAVDYDALIRFIAGGKKPTSSLLVYFKDKVIPINLTDIALFYITGETTSLLGFDKKSYLVDQSLEQLENTCGNEFFRINRQFLLNRKSVKDITHYFPRKYIVNTIFEFRDPLVVSKNRTTPFLQWLKK